MINPWLDRYNRKAPKYNKMVITKETLDIIKWRFNKIENELKSVSSEKSKQAKSDLLDWINQNRKFLFENKSNIEDKSVIIDFEYLLECASCLNNEKPFPKFINDLQQIIKVDKIHYSIEIDLLNKIYMLSNDEIFNCEEADFYTMVECADFSKMNIITKTKVQRLVFYLSKVMPKNWYFQVAKSRGWTKDNCSSSNVPKDTDEWRNKIEKLDKRLQKTPKGL